MEQTQGGACISFGRCLYWGLYLVEVVARKPFLGGLARLQLHSCIMCMNVGIEISEVLLRSHAAFSIWSPALLKIVSLSK